MRKKGCLLISGGMDSALSGKIAEVEGYDNYSTHFIWAGPRRRS